MGKKFKAPDKPKSGDKISVPASANLPTIDYPVFCFRHIHKDYGIDDCQEDDKVAFLKRIVKLSSLSWEEIYKAPRHGWGTEKIEINSIKPSCPRFITPDVSFLLALRYHGLKPFLIHKVGYICHVIFIDKDFSVYDH